ncbi:MAG: hypothetical protein ACRDV7_07470, partial [Acidimicrobiia bacterium]
VQPAEEWSAWFADEGFVRVLEYDASYLAPWAILYERRRGHLPDVVRDYDRVLARMKVEVDQLRASILQMHAEREAEGIGGGSEAGRARLEEQQREIDSLHEQLLNARDIIAGLEVEVGEAIGQNAYHIGLLAGKDAAAREYERVVASKAYRATLKALSPYRRVRRFLGQ